MSFFQLVLLIQSPINSATSMLFVAQCRTAADTKGTPFEFLPCISPCSSYFFHRNIPINILASIVEDSAHLNRVAKTKNSICAEFDRNRTLSGERWTIPVIGIGIGRATHGKMMAAAINDLYWYGFNLESSCIAHVPLEYVISAIIRELK